MTDVDAEVRVLAVAAVPAMCKDNGDEVATIMHEIERRSEFALAAAVQIWCDLFTSHACGRPVTGPVRVAITPAMRGPLNPADAAVQWAEQMLIARAAYDDAAVRAGFDALPTNGYAVRFYIVRLLQLVAWSFSLPIGHAQFGPTS